MHPITGPGLSTLDHAPRLGDLGPCLDRFEALEPVAVELSLPYFEVICGGRIQTDRLAELKRLCADRPFGFTVHGAVASNFTDPRHLALQLDAARACLEVCGEIGASVLVKHAGILPRVSAGQRADLLAIERDALASLAAEAEAAGTVLTLETLFGRVDGWTATPAELAAQITAIGHPHIRACADLSHSFLNAAERGTDARADLALLAPLTRHLHIHDSFGRPKTFAPYGRGEEILFGLGDLHLPPGRGSLPWEALATLPWAGPSIANLELLARHDDQLGSAVAWTRAWAETANAAAQARIAATSSTVLPSGSAT